MAPDQRWSGAASRPGLPCGSVDLLDVQPIVLVTGIPASGKSTVADLLARRFARGVHVKGDVYRRMVVAGREEMTADPSEEAWRQLRLRYRLGATTAEAYHEAGFSVVLQDVVVGAPLGEVVASIGRRPLVVVVLAPGTDTVAERERNRPKTAYRGEMSDITAMDAALRAETPRLGLWVDTSDQSPRTRSRRSSAGLEGRCEDRAAGPTAFARLVRPARRSGGAAGGGPHVRGLRGWPVGQPARVLPAAPGGAGEGRCVRAGGRGSARHVALRVRPSDV